MQTKNKGWLATGVNGSDYKRRVSGGAGGNRHNTYQGRFVSRKLSRPGECEGGWLKVVVG